MALALPQSRASQSTGCVLTARAAHKVLMFDIHSPARNLSSSVLFLGFTEKCVIFASEAVPKTAVEVQQSVPLVHRSQVTGFCVPYRGYLCCIFSCRLVWQVRGTGRNREQVCPAEAFLQTVHHLLAYPVLFREVTPSVQREWKHPDFLSHVC